MSRDPSFSDQPASEDFEAPADPVERARAELHELMRRREVASPEGYDPSSAG